MSLGHDASTKSLLYREAGLTESWDSSSTSEPISSNLEVPEFLTPGSFYRFGWGDLVGSLFTAHADAIKEFSATLFQNVPLLPRRIAAKPLSASLVVHLLIIPLLPFLLQVVPRAGQIDPANELRQHEIVYYHFTKDPVRTHTPKLVPMGPGGQPGIGSIPQLSPKKGASASLGNLTIVSRPRIPDNDHQTILQSKSPADLKIQADLTLPNLVVGQPSVQRPHLEFKVGEVRPVQPTAVVHATDEPTLTRTPVDSGINGMIGVATRQPHLPVPVGGALAAPHVTQHGVGGVEGNADAPVIADAGNGSGESGLLILGTNPGSSAQVVALPPGNRYGQFSVGAGGGEGGSPGGVEGGHASGGAGGKGSGGDGSSGVGNGNFGGGGGSEGANGFVSLHGNGEAGGGSLGDPPLAASQLVFAIPESMLLRHNKLVVSAGPVGGGGSSVYGVLPCGRIYTVFLATGQKQWSLQYCQKSAVPESASNKARLTVVHMELPILPPEAIARFNFKRVPLPPEKASKSILLRGALTEEGKVENVEVYQGLVPVLDEAARAAFQKWTFKPAMRSGKPLRVEILISIPME